MASTLLPVNAIEYAKTFLGGKPIDRIQDRVLADVSAMFWLYAPWRWTLGLMTQITLVSDTQDYTITLPADFLYLHDAFIVDGKTTRHLKPTAIFAATGSTYKPGLPGSISVQNVSGTDKYRLDVTPGDVGSSTQKIVGIYKKIVPAITGDNAFTAAQQGFPDEYFWVFQEGVLWRAMLWDQDPRAGSVTVQGGKTAYTGQRAIFEDALQTCARQEKLYLEDPQEEQK